MAKNEPSEIGESRKRKEAPTDWNQDSQTQQLPSSTQQRDEEAVAVDTATVTYWDSGDARRTFAPKQKYGLTCDVKKVVLARVELLEAVNRKATFWKSLFEGGDPDNTCTSQEIFLVRHRSLYLACALRKFVEEVKECGRWTWQRCIQFSIATMNDLGIETYSSWETLRRWHRRLAVSRQEAFCKAPPKKSSLPLFFVRNPDAMDAFKKFGVLNLKDLSVEKMSEYLQEQLVPALIKKLERGEGLDSDESDAEKKKSPIPKDTVKEYLRPYRLTKISVSTVLRWMHAVGFNYQNRQKHYFVDGHERPETLKYRPIYIRRYLSHEVNTHRWVQLSMAESNLLKEKGLINNELAGYCYKDSNGVDMVEYHVDNCEKIKTLELPPHGGNLSVRKPVDRPPVMIIGQDEAIFKQFLFVSKMWTGPNGERPLLPKDEGAGVMISSFICREHGILREIDEHILIFVNTNRLGKSYADEEAAIEVNGTAAKKPLTKSESPFLLYFDYGENRDGYWNYNHMVLQFEDTIDVLKVMYPNFKFVYLFDHSSGHSKTRPDGLNVSRMNKSYGGKQTAMRSTVIEREEGFLGPFQRHLQVGDTQHLMFQPTDTGPFWMSEEKKEATRHDVVYGEPNKLQRNKSELIADLQGKSINTKGFNKKELVKLCEKNDIVTIIEVDNITEGWEGKAKGLVQVLWERGLIDGNKLSKYSLDGKKDANKLTILETSLRHLMGLCTDFLHEQGMMEFIGAKLGVEVILTPKCHAELAGEGVEYMWACAKGWYRTLSLREKRGKENFKMSVRKCLSAKVLSVERIRKFSRRARQYKLAYHFFDSGQTDPEIPHGDGDQQYGPVAVEKLIGKFKTHRCAMDFDFKFIMSS
jgi:hypothetical protein